MFELTKKDWFALLAAIIVLVVGVVIVQTVDEPAPSIVCFNFLFVFMAVRWSLRLSGQPRPSLAPTPTLAPDPLSRVRSCMTGLIFPRGGNAGLDGCIDALLAPVLKDYWGDWANVAYGDVLNFIDRLMLMQGGAFHADFRIDPKSVNQNAVLAVLRHIRAFSTNAGSQEFALKLLRKHPDVDAEIPLGWMLGDESRYGKLVVLPEGVEPSELAILEHMLEHNRVTPAAKRFILNELRDRLDGAEADDSDKGLLERLLHSHAYAHDTTIHDDPR